jgi:nucleoside phosphorylase
VRTRRARRWPGKGALVLFDQFLVKRGYNALVTADAPTAVIMTALQVEYAAARLFLADIEQLVHPAGTVYETSRALDSFRPTVAMFVGVAGGLRDVTIGDVVAADYVFGYESSRVTDISRPRIKSLGCGYPLVQRARAIRRQNEWHKRISSDSMPHAFVGPIASGEQILAGERTPTHQLLEEHCGDALAVEMEGWGFLFAAHTNGDVPAVVIRGISDMTFDKDSGHDPGRQLVAADHAAAFAFELLETLNTFGTQRIRPARPWRRRQL